MELVDGVRQVQKIERSKWTRERGCRRRRQGPASIARGGGNAGQLTCFSPRGLGRHLEETKPRVIQHLGRGVARRCEGRVLSQVGARGCEFCGQRKVECVSHVPKRREVRVAKEMCKRCGERDKR